ncbi:hypothetical protein MKL29_00890 [Streptococcus suis]|nr:hypothetical protein [Streptococcus suis]
MAEQTSAEFLRESKRMRSSLNYMMQRADDPIIYDRGQELAEYIDRLEEQYITFITAR